MMTAAIYRSSPLVFGGFLLVVLWAFWPTYFSRPSHQLGFRFHVHGLSLTLWCIMLVSQACLIRSGRRRLHRLLGKSSFLLVPVIVAAAIALKHSRMQGFQPTDAALYSLASVLFALVAFAVIYGLAIRHRREPPVHARYMIATVFPLFSPLTDRLIVAHVQPMLGWIHLLGGDTAVPFINVVGFIVADLTAVALSIWDWRSSGQLQAFPVTLAVLVVFQGLVFAVYRLPQWRTFGEWFVSMPLS